MLNKLKSLFRSINCRSDCCEKVTVIKIDENKQGMSENVKKQLHVFHDPFSGATAQPKIPDGKTAGSLGISTQSVREFVNKEDTDDVMHMILYAGQNSGLCVFNGEFPNNSATTPVPQTFYQMGFTDMGGPNWTNLPTGSSGTDTAKYNVDSTENYALWRVVSAGLQLKLLNAQEEDDGWFEACRVIREVNPAEYSLCCKNGSLDKGVDGTIAPQTALLSLRDQEIVNDPSYCTGLLRDLSHVQFQLNSKMDLFDWTSKRESQRLQGGGTSGTSLRDFSIPDDDNKTCAFRPNSSNAAEVIDNYIDEHYDMIYIRLHCRNNGSAVAGENGSRLHTNLVSNQEVYFETSERDNRYHTSTESIGEHVMSIHGQARRANKLACTPI